MLTLALETATVPGSVVITVGDDVVASHAFVAGERAAKWLAPTIKHLFGQIEPSIAETQLICCTQGPGSFTGLRIGVTTAKMLAYANGCPVVALNTLDVIASQTPCQPKKQLHVVLAAERKQLFVRSYAVRQDRWHPVSETNIIDAAAWLQSVNNQPSGQLVSGPAAAQLREGLNPRIETVRSELLHPQAAAVARLGLHEFQAGASIDIWTLKPQYFRRSYAEENR